MTILHPLSHKTISLHHQYTREIHSLLLGTLFTFEQILFDDFCQNGHTIRVCFARFYHDSASVHKNFAKSCTDFVVICPTIVYRVTLHPAITFFGEFFWKNTWWPLRWFARCKFIATIILLSRCYFSRCWRWRCWGWRCRGWTTTTNFTTAVKVGFTFSFYNGFWGFF